jgi:hypothetical protein
LAPPHKPQSTTSGDLAYTPAHDVLGSDPFPIPSQKQLAADNLSQ